jgi:hypothetical protein
VHIRTTLSNDTGEASLGTFPEDRSTLHCQQFLNGIQRPATISSSQKKEGMIPLHFSRILDPVELSTTTNSKTLDSTEHHLNNPM